MKDLLIGEWLLGVVVHLHPHHGSWTGNPMPPPPRLSKTAKWGLPGNPREWGNSSSEIEACKTQEADGITFPPRCSEEEFRAPLWEAIHWCTQPMSFLPRFLIHAIRKDANGLKVEAFSPKTKQPGNQIAWSSWNKNPTCRPRWRPCHDD